jgi:hypothetical protein
MTSESLRSGDVVEVKSAAEILATLNDQGALDGLPFMSEMVEYCGRRVVVDKRADKICDTIRYTGSRRLPDTVLLGDLRCDGSGHEGCQAECRLFWKAAWLRRVDPARPAAPVAADDGARSKLVELCSGNIRRAGEVDGRPAELFRCQATELLAASQLLRTFDPRPYVHEYTSGNVPLPRFLKVAARAAVQEPMRKFGLLKEPRLRGNSTAPKEPPLNLQPGEWVQVKSKEEILATLNPKGMTRGLWFDVEMAPYCGGTYKVKKRVTRIIDDRTSQLISFNSDCIMLEDVVCSGDLSLRRWFCPRAIYPYWREAWLRRTQAPATATVLRTETTAAPPPA